MGDFLFLILSALAIGFAAAMVLARNSVHGAMCLLLSLAAVAGLFVQLHAFLLAFLLILVYAGAIVALFLFIIMLLDVRGLGPVRRRGIGIAAGVISAALLAAGVASLGAHASADLPGGPPAASAAGLTLRGIAESLFTAYLLPIEVLGFLLLIAMLGVIALSQHAGGGESSRK